MNKKELVFIANCQKAKKNLWHYCKVKAPDFYKEERTYQKEMANALQDFYNDDNDILIINLPPRHGKSRTVGNAVEWYLGNNTNLKIMTGSYNEKLSTKFSKGVRNTILQKKTDEQIIYSDIFNNVYIPRGSSSINMWALNGSSTENYLATSPSGSATGMGADFIIIDDLIKSSYEAHNEVILNDQWEWFTDTMLSRLEGKRKIILIMTRWSKNDLCGKATEHFEKIGMKIKNLTYRAKDEQGNMLCDDILDIKSYNNIRQTQSKDIFEANYNQMPIDLKGRLYTRFMEYDKLPDDIIAIESYTDTADMGKDYLASIIYAYNRLKDIYVLHIIYTKDSMEITEPLVAQSLIDYKVRYAHIESNNGGRGFARNVRRLLHEKGHKSTSVKPFTQTNNKNARIYSNSAGVTNTVHYPRNWKEKYPEAYTSMFKYQREGKNGHDDLQDCITGAYEKVQEKNYRKR